jgi:hypothetical protein
MGKSESPVLARPPSSRAVPGYQRGIRVGPGQRASELGSLVMETAHARPGGAPVLRQQLGPGPAFGRACCLHGTDPTALERWILKQLDTHLPVWDSE